MAKSENELHHECMNRFIGLANDMKDEGASLGVVSAALMSASAVYATFTAVGNEGSLTDSGVDKMAAAYRNQLDQVQQAKRREQEPQSGS